MEKKILYCPSCGMENMKDFKFCVGCGRKLEGILNPVREDVLEKRIKALIEAGFARSGRDLSDEKSDEITEVILNDGYVEGKNLWRRWILAQVMRGLKNSRWSFEEYYFGKAGTPAMMPYMYAWQTLLNELNAQRHIKDEKVLEMRRKFFNKETAVGMMMHYIKHIRKIIGDSKVHNERSSGHKYIYVKSRGKQYIARLNKSISEAEIRIKRLTDAATPSEEFAVVDEFVQDIAHGGLFRLPIYSTKGNAFRNAFYGAGAYYALDNMIKFHGVILPGCSDMYTSLSEVKAKREQYEGDYYRLFAYMKSVIEETDFTPDWN